MKRLEEYLSNCTSDFSDGTNGEPSAPGRTVGDTGTTVGVPDYKYLERKKARSEKLKALLKRRDPDGIEKPMKGVREGRLSPEEMSILKSRPRRRRRLPVRENAPAQADIDMILAMVIED